MERKYITEFGLNVFTSFKTIIPVEHLDMVDDEHKYHIYFIMACPRVIIDMESLHSDENGIHINLKQINSGNVTTILTDPIKLHSKLDHRKVKLKTQYPYTKVNILINDIEFLEEFYKNEEKPISIDVDAQAILNLSGKSSPWEFEVLYIGQSYGSGGERTAQKRLASHSTLQKILIDCHSKYQDKQLFIFLLEMTPMLNTSFDGITKNYSTTSDEDDKHICEVLSNLPEYQQVINITEAALINYFKPDYNVNFVENFPDNNHKGYRQYFSLDYNCLTVELDIEFDNVSVQLYTKTNKIHSSWDFIQYNLYNDANRKNMYEIFR